MPDLRVKQLRTPRSRGRPRRLRNPLAGSALAHILVLAIIILVRFVAVPVKPPEEPSFAIEFEPDKSQTPGGPNPSKATETPQGVKAPEFHPTPTPAQPPPSPPQSEPRVDTGMPDFSQPPPPPEPAPEAEALPPPTPQPRRAPQRQRQTASRNPFANPMQFSLAPRQPRSLSAGLQNSRSLDLSAGPVVRGGRLQEAVAHVVGPGGQADYMALLSEFIEEHKYYPPSAAANGEEGSAVVQITVSRDGTVRSLRLAQSSGSSLLDAAWTAVFRDNRLPEFTDDMPQQQASFTLELNYELIYRR